MKRSIVLLSALTLSACAGHDEVARVVSPDGAIDAVLVESNGGAITAFWYDIYLVRHGEPWRRARSVAWLYDAVRSEQAYGVNIVWAAADRLEAQFSQAAQTRVYQPEVTVAGVPVKIVLRVGLLRTVECYITALDDLMTAPNQALERTADRRDNLFRWLQH